MPKRYVILFLLMGFGAAVWLIAEELDKELELKFPHKIHVVDEELECLDCHDSVNSSATGLDNLFPSKEVCSDCHEVEEKDNCNKCHSDTKNPRIIPRVEKYNQKFSHQKHLKSGLECESCHRGMPQKLIAEPAVLPSMVNCIDCHKTKFVSTECNVCHLPEDNLRPISHTPGFIHNHSDLARSDAQSISADKSCATCHQTNFCQSCHEGDNLDRLTHPLNFEFTHALNTQGRERECAVCHSERQFCIACHQDNLVMPHNHTPGWSNQIPNDGGRHRVEALNDLDNCMSCHEQNAEQVCQTCHKG